MSEIVADKVIRLKSEVQVEKLQKLMKVSMQMNKGQERSLKMQAMYAQMMVNSFHKMKRSIPNVSSPRTTASPLKTSGSPKQTRAPTSTQAEKAAQRELNAVTKINEKLDKRIKDIKAYGTQAERVAATELEVLRSQKLSSKEKKLQLEQTERNIKANKRQESSLKKQNFLMQRMNNSAKQYAGNMISAFAVMGVARSVTTIGQDFEAVGNTMLAVSENAQESGQNLKFVKDEAYRLGLGLKESAKGFAKMVAARGELSLEDTKKAFTGISEMSTLLGLSAEESSRSINALQQIDGLPYTEMYL